MIIDRLEKNLKIKIKNKNYFIEALTHKSANEKNNNEKLEFLGDRVIALILSKKLFDLYPNESEGVLDKRFAKLVNRTACASVAWDNNLNHFIVTGDKKKKITNKDDKILSDTCEAIIGAIYLDQGFNYVSTFVLRIWSKYLAKSNITVLDAKTQLQEYSLKHFKKLPLYRLCSSKGPKHNPVFKINVSIKTSKEFTGLGSSKKNAQQSAAKSLLKSLKLN